MIRRKIFYTLSKYVTYGLKFVQALLIAKCLGPTGLAVYGFAQLIALYSSFINFGIPPAIHTILSISQDKDSEKSEMYISVGFTFILLIGIVLCSAGGLFVYGYPMLFEKFQFHKYGIISVVIGINIILVQFFANIYQVYSQYIRIALNELVSVLILFCIVYIYRHNEESLLYYTLLVSASSIFINLFFFLHKAPFKITFSLNNTLLKVIIKMGIPMLIANVGFYLIMVSVRSISSYHYSLHQVGLFTFGLNIASTVLMGLNAMGWTYYSTIIANTCNDVEEAYLYVQKVNKIYNFVLCVTIFLGILILPLLFYFLPAYKEFSAGISILLLTQIFTSLSFGYSSMLVAQKQQNKLALISFITLLTTVVLSVAVCILDLPFLYQTIVILISMFIYSLQICYLGAKVCRKNVFMVLFAEVYNLKVLIPAFLLLFIALAGMGAGWTLIVISIFLLISYKDIGFLLKLLRDINQKSQ